MTKETSTEETRIKLGYSLPIAGGAIIGALSIYDVFSMLSLQGQSIFSDVVIGSVLKGLFSFQIFTGLSSTALAFLGSYLLLRGRFKASVAANVLSVAMALVTLMNPGRYSFQSQTTVMVGNIIGVALISGGAVTGVTLRHREVSGGPLLRSIEVATTAVFSALYAVMILMLVVPSPTGGYTHIGDTVVFLAALLFGSKVGGLVGILGSVAADLYTAYPRWYVSVLAHGLEGLIPGLAKGKPLVVQVLVCVVGGFLMASTYFVVNIFLKGYPLAIISYVRDFFVQAGVSIVIAIIVNNVVKRVLPRFK